MTELKELRTKMEKVFGAEGLIANTEYIRSKDIKCIPSHENILKYYNYLKNGGEIPKGVDKKAYMANCIYLLTEKDPSFIKEFETEIFSIISSGEKPEDRMMTTFNIIEYINKYHDKLDINLNMTFKFVAKIKGKAEFLTLIMVYYSKGIIKYYLKEIKKAEEVFSEILKLLSQKERKFTETPLLYYIAKSTVEKLKNIFSSLPPEKSQNLKSVAINKYWELPYLALPGLKYLLEEEMKKIVPLSGGNGGNLGGNKRYVIQEDSDDDDKDETSSATTTTRKVNSNNFLDVELCLALAARIGYIGVITGETWIIREVLESFKTLIEVTRNWADAINEEKGKSNNSDEVKKDYDNKISLHCAYEFVAGIIKLYLGGEDQAVFDFALNFGKKFFPKINATESKGNIIINAQNNNDFLLNLLVSSEEKESLSNHLESKSINNILDQISKDPQAKVDPLQLFSMIISIHGEINSLLERASLEKDDNKKKDMEDKAILYGTKILDFPTNHKKEHAILNKPFILELLLEIYISLQNIYLAKKEITKFKDLKSTFEKIDEIFGIKECQNISSLDALTKLEADELYLNNEYEKAEKVYQKALEKDEHNPLLMFNLGYMQFLQEKNNIALATIKKSLEEFGDLEKNGNLSPLRTEIFKKSKELAMKLVKHLEKYEG